MTQINKDNNKSNIGRNILDKFKSNGSFNNNSSSNPNNNSKITKKGLDDKKNTHIQNNNRNVPKKRVDDSTKNSKTPKSNNFSTGFKRTSSSNPKNNRNVNNRLDDKNSSHVQKRNSRTNNILDDKNSNNSNTITIPYSSVIKLTNWIKNNGYGYYKDLYLVLKGDNTLGMHSDREKCKGSIILGNVEDFPTLVRCFKGHFNPKIDVPKLHKDLNTKLQSILDNKTYKRQPKNDYKTLGKSNIHPIKQGKISVGTVKTTKQQHKLHYTQMTIEELRYLGSYLNTVQKVKKSYHLKEKINRKEVTLDMAIIYKNFHDINNYTSIIEYNETYDSDKNRWTQRVILRCKDNELVILNGKKQLCNQCVVYDITKNTIITTYYNRANDNHRSLHDDRYDLTRIATIKPGGLKQSSIQEKQRRA